MEWRWFQISTVGNGGNQKRGITLGKIKDPKNVATIWFIFMQLSLCMNIKTIAQYLYTLEVFSHFWPVWAHSAPPPSISVVYQPISMKFSHHVTYHVSFPKNIGLALYDLYDVINDVINSKNRNFQKLLQITIFDRFWWIRMEIKA